MSTIKPRFTDTRLIRTPHYGQFDSYLGKESPYSFPPKFNQLNMDRPV